MASDPDPLPPDAWLASIARGEADLAAGRVKAIDIEELCQELEAEAAACERQAARRQASPA